MNETWKDIKGYEGFYQISDYGSVKSLERMVPHGESFQPVKERMLKPKAKTHSGHLEVGLSHAGRVKTFLVHSLVLETFGSPRPEGLVCRHLDGDPTNNHISNLCWGTQKENKDDQRDHGRMTEGEAHPRAVFTDDLVRVIRRRHHEGVNVRRLAEDYHADFSTIWDIVHFRSWDHVPPEDGVPKAKPVKRITKPVVLEIRRLAKDGKLTKDLSAQFNLSRAAICNIIARRSWANV